MQVQCPNSVEGTPFNLFASSKLGLVWANPRLLHIGSGQKGRIILNGGHCILSELLQTSVLSENEVKTRPQIDLIQSDGDGLCKHIFFGWTGDCNSLLRYDTPLGFTKTTAMLLELFDQTRNVKGIHLVLDFLAEIAKPILLLCEVGCDRLLQVRCPQRLDLLWALRGGRSGCQQRDI